MKYLTLLAAISPAVLALPMIDIGVIVPFTSPFSRRSIGIEFETVTEIGDERFNSSSPGDSVFQLGDLTWILNSMKEAMSRTMAGFTDAVNLKPQSFQVIPIEEVTIEIIDIGLPPIQSKTEPTVQPEEHLIASDHSNGHQQQTVMGSRPSNFQDEINNLLKICNNPEQPTINHGPSYEEDPNTIDAGMEEMMEDEALVEALVDAGIIELEQK